MGDETLTADERDAVKALRKWCHRDSPVAADCDRILAAGECPDDDDTLLTALRLFSSPTQHEKG